MTPQHQPILEFRGNEVYGLAADGLTAWQLGTDGYSIMPATMGQSVIKDFRVWHTYEGAIYNYPSHRMTVDGLVYRIDPGRDALLAVRLPVRRLPERGRHDPQRQHSRRGRLRRVYRSARQLSHRERRRRHLRPRVLVRDAGHARGPGADRPPTGVVVTLRNNRVQPWPGRPLRTIEMNHNTSSRGNSQPDDRYEVVVYDYQRQAGSNFRVYFAEQATENLYGGLAPCRDTTTTARNRRDHVRPELRACAAHRLANRPIKKSWGCGAAAERVIFLLLYFWQQF